MLAAVRALVERSARPGGDRTAHAAVRGAIVASLVALVAAGTCSHGFRPGRVETLAGTFRFGGPAITLGVTF